MELPFIVTLKSGTGVGLLHFVSFTALIGIAYRHTPVRLSLVSNPLFRGFLSLDTSPTKKATIKVALLLVSSVGLLHFVLFTALIGIAYRHTPVRLSLVSNPLFRGFLSLDTSPTKKATIKVALLLVSSVGLLHFVLFTALIGIAYRHTPVRLSLVSNPLSRGFLSLDISPTKKSHHKGGFTVGELGGIRTRDPLIKSQMLYRLSYELA